MGQMSVMVFFMVLIGYVNSKPASYLIETKDVRGGESEFGNDYMDEEGYNEEVFAEEGEDYHNTEPPPITTTQFVPDVVVSEKVGGWCVFNCPTTTERQTSSVHPVVGK